MSNDRILFSCTRRALALRAFLVAIVGVASAGATAPLVFAQVIFDEHSTSTAESHPLNDGQSLGFPEHAERLSPANEHIVPEGFAVAHEGGSPADFFGSPDGPHVQDEYGNWEWSPKSLWPPTYCLHCFRWFGLRHSHTHGRHVGLGAPFVATSWLNRPYYIGAELGTLWVMRSQDDHVSRDTDIIGGVFLGWDWDHFWGSELRFNWATPELINSEMPDADRTDSLFTWSANFLYYPWGDSKFRPYWRWGLGSTRFDFPTDDGTRRDEWLLTMPIGIGMKYPIRRWLTARTEFTDQFSLGSDGLPTQHNLTLTLGLECHFGAHPKSYWPWNPSRHIW